MLLKIKPVCISCGQENCGGWHFKKKNLCWGPQNLSDVFLKEIDIFCAKNHLGKTDAERIHPKGAYNSILMRKTFWEGYQAALNDMKNIISKEKNRRTDEIFDR